MYYYILMNIWVPKGNRTYGDAPEPWQLGLQDPGCYLMEDIVQFHDWIMYILVLILSFVLWLIVRALTTNNTNMYLVDAPVIEIIWTLIPAGVLMFIALPSLKLLYLMDEIGEPALTIKAVGHQWY